ncbi:MAG: sulfite exporter TauE/SafE family protein [Thermoleophilia bacterium]
MALATLSKRLKILTSEFELRCTASTIFLLSENALFKEAINTTAQPGRRGRLHAGGGGIFFVPAFVVLFRLRIKEAIATSLPLVLILALPGSAVHLALGHVDLATTASMAIGVIPMAYLGAKLDIHTRSIMVMLLYGVVMLVFAIYFFVCQLR